MFPEPIDYHRRFCQLLLVTLLTSGYRHVTTSSTAAFDRDETEDQDVYDYADTPLSEKADDGDAENKHFMDVYSLKSGPQQLEFGHVFEDPNVWEQRYEKKDFDSQRHQGKVKWGDKDGSYGEQYWDLNHGGADESAYDNGENGQYESSPPETGQYESYPPENGQYESPAPENGYYELYPPKNRHYKSYSRENGHYESSRPKNKHYESSPPENRHYEPSPPENGHYKSFRSENKHYESSSPENRHYEPSPPEYGHYESSRPENKHYESSPPENRHYEPSPPENGHYESSPPENRHYEPSPIENYQESRHTAVVYKPMVVTFSTANKPKKNSPVIVRSVVRNKNIILNNKQTTTEPTTTTAKPIAARNINDKKTAPVLVFDMKTGVVMDEATGNKFVLKPIDD